MRSEQATAGSASRDSISATGIAEALIQSSVDGVLAFDQECRYTVWNAAMERISGVPANQALGRYAFDLFPFLKETGEDRYFHEVLNGNTVVTRDRRFAVPHTGEQGYFEGHYSPLRDRSGQIIGGLAVIRETTAQHTGTEAIRLALKLAATRVLVETVSSRDKLGRLLQTICQHIGWKLAALWLADETARVLRCADVWYQEPRLADFARVTQERSFAPGEGFPGSVWAKGEPAWIPNVVEDANAPRASVALQAGLRAVLGFPIQSEGRVIGVMEFFSEAIEQPDEPLLALLGFIGAQVGQLIEQTEAEEAARQSDALKSAILNAALDAIITMDHHGKVVEWNPAAERVFGHARAHALGREMARLIIPAGLRDQHCQGLARYVATGEGPVLGKRLELTALHADGTEFPVELTIVRVSTEGPPMFTGYLRDITEQRTHLRTLQDQQEELGAANEELQAANEELADKQAELEAANEELHEQQQQLLQTTTALRESEAALREESQTLETVNCIGQLLAAELDLQKLLQALTDAATEISEAQFGSFFYNTVNEQGEAYMLYTLSGVSREAFEKFPMPRNTAIFAPTFAGEGTVRLADVTQDSRYGKNAPHFGMPQGHLPVRSYLALPVRSRSGEVLGGLFFGHADEGVFTGRHARLLEGVAAQAAVAIDNARLYQQARAAEAVQQRRAREAALVADVGIALSQIAELPAMLGRVTDAVVKHLDAAFARIWAINEADQVLELRASSGMYTHLDGPHSRIPIGSYKIGLLAAERRPHLTNSVATDPRVSDQEWAQREGMVAFAGYPLLVGDRLLGVMALFARQPLAQDALDALGSIADIVAQGMERKRLEDEVRHRADELAEADRRKDEFLAMLGHELRNPLSPALTSLHVLKERPPEDPAFGRAREVAERQLRNMARIVDDLLDVARITRGKIELRKGSLDLNAVVSRTAEAVRPVMEGRRHKLICSLPEGPVHIHADLTRVDQVLTNLLTNAAKYTDPGGTIWLTLEKDGADAVIRVRDTGIGIPGKMLPQVFDLFVQNERSLDRSQGGLGIGLTLVKRLVEMHGGSVTVTSPGPRQGSEFTVRFPALAAHLKQEAQREAAKAPSAPPRSFRILVVDDNQDAAETLAELLEAIGHTVACAHDGLAAIEKAFEQYPLDVILLDIGLPGLSGYEVAQRLRAEERFQQTVFIALTGYGSAGDHLRSREAGFNHHLVKPVEPAVLLKLLAELRSPEPGKAPF